uniref:Ion_trans domain-containing protein n=1 Tax=Macrostomum lignano TaxID=282301 RepID=A0A1I8FAC2_9PLAT
ESSALPLEVQKPGSGAANVAAKPKSSEQRHGLCSRMVCDTYELLRHAYGALLYTSLLLAVFVLSFMVEAVKQLLVSGESVADHLAKGWNLMDFASMAIFTLAAIVALDTGSVKMMRICRILLGLALFFYFCRLLQNFSVHVNLGPKVVMIQTMIIEDLIPFMVIFMVFVVGYGVFVWSTIFPMSTPDMGGAMDAVMSLLKLAYFLSHLANYKLATSAAKTPGAATSRQSYWDSYIVFTNVLLLNLLIAMFAVHIGDPNDISSNTYERIQSSSMQYWTLQRYLIMREYTERQHCAAASVAAIFEDFLRCIVRRLRVSEEQLTKWEGLRSQEFLRRRQEANQQRRRANASDPAGRRQLQLPSQSAAGTTDDTASAVAAAAAAAQPPPSPWTGTPCTRWSGFESARVSATPRSSCVELTMLTRDASDCLSGSTRLQEEVRRLGQRMELQQTACLNCLNQLLRAQAPSSTSTYTQNRPPRPPSNRRLQARAVARSGPGGRRGVPGKRRESPRPPKQPEAEAIGPRRCELAGVAARRAQPHGHHTRESPSSVQFIRPGSRLQPPLSAVEDRCPLWGPNHGLVVLITRWKRDDKHNLVKKGSQKVLQYVSMAEHCCLWVSEWDFRSGGSWSSIPNDAASAESAAATCNEQLAMGWLQEALVAESRAAAQTAQAAGPQIEQPAASLNQD